MKGSMLQRRLLAANDFQNPEIVFRDQNPSATTENISLRDKLEDPTNALIFHSDLVVGMDRVRGGAASDLEPFKKWI
jgi:hypothetical protein